jgi:Arc-like DNA binding domain
MAREKATDKLQVKVRMPRRLADELSAEAEKSGVSLSTEIVNRLQASFAVSGIRNLSRIAGQRPGALEYLSYITAAASGASFEAVKKGHKAQPNVVIFGPEEAKKK